MRLRTILVLVLTAAAFVLVWAAASIAASTGPAPPPRTGVIIGGSSALELDGPPRDGDVIGWGTRTGDGCRVDLSLTVTPGFGESRGNMGARIGPDCAVVYVAHPDGGYWPGGVTKRPTVEGD